MTQTIADTPFAARHNGLTPADLEAMSAVLGVPGPDALIEQTVPPAIRRAGAFHLPPAVSESACLEELRALAARNVVTKSFLGQGYHDTVVPGVILRNVLENPGWYTAYTPYQAEISQGRLEALLNYQTMVADLTGMDLANASLLDEATAAAEALTMVHRLRPQGGADRFFVASDCHPQTLAVVRTRAKPLGIEVVVGDPDTFDFAATPVAGALVQNPATDGRVRDLTGFIRRAHDNQAVVVVAADILSLALVTPPGAMGADVVVGTTQRFGVPMGFGGPHAAYLATRQAYARQMPGRLIGVSEDAQGSPALRMALQTREQHIRREKATSNVCTAQVLLAVMAGLYAVYHGPDGVRGIAARVHRRALDFAAAVSARGYKVRHGAFFDTVVIDLPAAGADALYAAARRAGLTPRRLSDAALGVSFDEAHTDRDVAALLAVFTEGGLQGAGENSGSGSQAHLPAACVRTGPILTHPVFSSCRTETEMLRYIKQLEAKDYSLVHGMIPLGSCTMKLNATTEMIPVTWGQFGNLHPFAPAEDARGYAQLFADLEAWLAEVTGFDAVSLQPNAGSQGEYAGMLAIRAYHDARGDRHRTICLIPQSAHGTNPASAVMAGLQVVAVKCDALGNVDVPDLRARVAEHRDRLAALMVTYPSTHGVFEESIQEVCEVVHAAGGQVYMDGANMNAQVGLCRPGDIGADVCHLNLHKTFCIPHGGGGPGMGPIGVKKHLAPFLPGHPLEEPRGHAVGPVSAAPFGSASILVIPWVYIKLMGPAGLTEATRQAILSANYVAKRLEGHYPVLYRNKGGRVAHECILDLRPLKAQAGVEAEDVAKRLMDYGFHAPTLSFPVPGTLMVEPTESEPLAELDRFVEALIQIRQEIAAIARGDQPRDNNLLKNAPHTMHVVTASEWTRPYSREQAAFPTRFTRAHKFWPTVGRLNNVLGDRTLVCTCPPVADYE